MKQTKQILLQQFIKETYENYRDEDIAIVGMAGVYPDAKNIDEFWSNLVSGKNSVQDIPKTRWNWKDYQ